jgi:hypothetical protein
MRPIRKNHRLLLLPAMVLLGGCAQPEPAAKRHPLTNYTPAPARVRTSTASTGTYPAHASAGRLPGGTESAGSVQSYRSAGRYPGSSSLGVQPYAKSAAGYYPAGRSTGTWGESQAIGRIPSKDSIGASPAGGEMGVLPREK